MLSTINPKISVIVPVYNVEKYLPECIESIMAQTYTDFELLLIDDGSPDSSGRICDEYATRDSRIRVFHKENGGVSSARNLGIEQARGEWITFFDGDDIISSETLSICAAYFSKYDIIRFSIKFDYGDSVSVVSISEHDDLYHYRLKVISRDAILGVCVGFYKKQLFTSKNIRFDNTLISGEDWLVQFELLMAAKSLKIINKPLYIYNRLNETSATTVYRFESHFSALRALRKIDTIANSNVNKEILERAVKIAEAQLVYDFLANKIVKRKPTKHKLMAEYKNLVSLKRNDIIKMKLPIRQKILLYLYLTPVGRLLFFR